MPNADIRPTYAIKHQAQWAEAAIDAYGYKKSNLQMQIGVMFPLPGCATMMSKTALRLRVAQIGRSRSGEGNGAALEPPALISDANLDGQERG